MTFSLYGLRWRIFKAMLAGPRPEHIDVTPSEWEEIEALTLAGFRYALEPPVPIYADVRLSMPIWFGEMFRHLG